jgi:hypothetical protein
MSESEIPPQESEDEAPRQPRKWWQWLLLYPALAVALLTAVPQWVETAQEAYKEFTAADSQTAGTAPESELVRFMKKNDECTRTPVDHTVTSPKNAEIWAVICSQTGDIFVMISTPSGEKIYSGVFVDEIADRIDSGKGIFVTSTDRDGEDELAHATNSAVLDLFAAHASPVDPWPAEPASRIRNEDQLRTAQATVVLCQVFRKDGTILRRLRTGNVCYDEVVNGSNGLVISRTQVDCNLPCPQ